MMFGTGRKLRVARAISDEIFYRRHGFMPTADQAEQPDTAMIAIAEVAILAADGDLDVIDTIRRDRDRALGLLLAHTEPRPIQA